MVRSGGKNGSKEECDKKQQNDAGNGWHCVVMLFFFSFLALISECLIQLQSLLVKESVIREQTQQMCV